MFTVCFHIDGRYLHRISDVLLNLCQNVPTREVSCRNDSNVFIDWCLKPDFHVISDICLLVSRL